MGRHPWEQNQTEGEEADPSRSRDPRPGDDETSEREPDGPFTEDDDERDERVSRGA